MNISESFEEIMQHAHIWNWVPDWQVAKDVYEAYPKSYSVLTPFAYSYLEELIRSLTSDYGLDVLNSGGTPKRRKVGIRLINLAIEENKHRTNELLLLLDELKVYFSNSTKFDKGDNRNSVVHGYMHPRYWDQDSFEKLIQDIARLSKFSGF